MKTLRLKTMIVTALVASIAIVGISGLAFGQTTAASKYSINLKQEKTAINKDVSRINAQQEKIASLKKQCRDERVAGIKSSTTRSEMIKAQADLDREKAYLRADKATLLQKHRTHINEHKVVLRDERFAYIKNKIKLDVELAKGDSKAVARAEAIVNKKHEIKENRTKLRQAKLDRNADVLAINKSVKDVNGQSPVVLLVENSSAKVQNLALK